MSTDEPAGSAGPARTNWGPSYWTLMVYSVAVTIAVAILAVNGLWVEAIVVFCLSLLVEIVVVRWARRRPR